MTSAMQVLNATDFTPGIGMESSSAGSFPNDVSVGEKTRFRSLLKMEMRAITSLSVRIRSFDPPGTLSRSLIVSLSFCSSMWAIRITSLPKPRISRRKAEKRTPSLPQPC